MTQIVITDEELEIARQAVENMLIEMRDMRLFTLRNNGLVVKEFDGTPSNIIRLGPEDAVRIGIQAINKFRSVQ